VYREHIAETGDLRGGSCSCDGGIGHRFDYIYLLILLWLEYLNEEANCNQTANRTAVWSDLVSDSQAVGDSNNNAVQSG
jgi:hypothetical protein